MTKENLLALMYDFYNEHILKGQNDDINYYLKQVKDNNAKDALVIGAGTGRVAIPLSKKISVTALDYDRGRLERLKQKGKNVDTICINFLDYNENKKYDLIIIPYSALQFYNNKKNLDLFFKEIYRLMSNNTLLIFDVSEGFNTKIEKDSEFLFKDFCEEINSSVEVYYTSKRFDDYIEFIVEYRLCDKDISVIENEKYYYYDKNLFMNAIYNNGLRLCKIDDGYCNNTFKHKHLYQCRRQI